VSTKHAVELLLETLKESTEKVTIVALAPLTNIAKAIRSDATTMRTKVDRIVWMGGAVAAGGNATSWAEANAFYDPEAAHIVLSSGLK
jgi:inosine-uridine nucleoside N-ribohydrolase